MNEKLDVENCVFRASLETSPNWASALHNFSTLIAPVLLHPFERWLRERSARSARTDRIQPEYCATSGCGPLPCIR